MKKLFSILLAAVLLLSLGACAEAEPEVYVPSANMEVAVAYVANDVGNVVTRKLTDQDVTSLNLACVYYSTSGYQLGEYELIQCTFSDQDALSQWQFEIPTGCIYIEAIVASVTLADGTEENCPGVSTWAQERVAAFSPENHAQSLVQMSYAEAAEAENCPGATLTMGTWEGTSLQVELSNTSGKDISQIQMQLLWFDEAGAPLDVQGTAVPNAELFNANDLVAEETASYTIVAPDNAAYAKAIINSVTYADAEVWSNNYIYEWTVVHYSSYE